MAAGAKLSGELSLLSRNAAAESRTCLSDSRTEGRLGDTVAKKPRLPGLLTLLRNLTKPEGIKKISPACHSSLSVGGW